MNITEAVERATDTWTSRRVFGEPVDKDGLTIIPAAVISGGAGGGSGHDPKGQEGEGGGFGVSAKPAGAYVVHGDQVRWHPALDLNRVVTVLGVVAVVYLFSRARVSCARARTAHDRES